MKVESANIQLAAQHTLVERREEHHSLQVRMQAPAAQAPGRAAATDRVSLSSEARAARPVAGEVGPEARVDDKDRLRMRLLMLVVERLTGKRLRLLAPEDLRAPSSTAAPRGRAETAREPAGGSGFGIRYEYHASHYESEQTRFEATGTLRTADGREITFDLGLSLGRTFMESYSVQLTVGEPVASDPLVLNLDGGAAALGEARFEFDLDLDGQSDQMRALAPGSGYLALDADGNGRIDHGGELFGPASGDGFAELAAHDTDGNGFIDAADPVYERLRIWSHDAEGNAQLMALGAAGVGAIYLGHVSTPFRLTDDANASEGQIRASGIFVGEDGSVGSVQQVDLVV